MAATGPLLMIVGGLILGGVTSDESAFLIGTTVVGFVGAFLVWRFGLWSKIVGIVVALGLAMMLFWTAFGIATPASFLDFVPGVLVPPGAIIAIIGCVAALVARRRGNLADRPEGRERGAIRTIVGVVAALALVSLVLTFMGRSTAPADTAAAETVVAADFEFPDTVEVSGGDTIIVRNNDGFFHTFTIEELGVDVALGPKSEEVIEIPEEPGEYVFYCQPHTMEPDEPGADDMAGRITVR